MNSSSLEYAEAYISKNAPDVETITHEDGLEIFLQEAGFVVAVNMLGGNWEVREGREEPGDVSIVNYEVASLEFQTISSAVKYALGLVSREQEDAA